MKYHYNIKCPILIIEYFCPIVLEIRWLSGGMYNCVFIMSDTVDFFKLGLYLQS